MPPISPHLPAAERDVLACLHRLGTATARDLREAIAAFRPMAHGSVTTLLQRLESKGLVVREKGPQGKAFIYRPNGRRRGTFRGLLGDLLHRVFHGDGVALVASLFESHPPKEAEIGKLEELLAELKKEHATRNAKRP